MKFITHKNFALSATVTTLFLRAQNAYAQGCNTTASNLGEVADELSCESGSLPILFTSASYVIGVGFTIAGLLKMKEYVDDPNRSYMKDALIRLGVGALLILLPFVINASAATFGGSTGGDYGRQNLAVFN